MNHGQDVVHVYTDGACSKNGKPDAKAGIGIYFDETDIRNISMRIKGKQTNNTAELTAVIYALSLFSELDKAIIHTDSSYVIKCCGLYGERMQSEGWIQDIPNKQLVKEIYMKKQSRPCIQIKHVRAHSKNTDIHSKGNRMADKLAKQSLSIEDG